MTIWPNVMEFCYQSWNLSNFPPELYQICMLFATSKNLSISVESPHFPMFAAKRRDAKSIRELVMEKLEMAMEKS